MVIESQVKFPSPRKKYVELHSKTGFVAFS